MARRASTPLAMGAGFATLLTLAALALTISRASARTETSLQGGVTNDNWGGFCFFRQDDSAGHHAATLEPIYLTESDVTLLSPKLALEGAQRQGCPDHWVTINLSDADLAPQKAGKPRRAELTKPVPGLYTYHIHLATQADRCAPPKDLTDLAPALYMVVTSVYYGVDGAYDNARDGSQYFDVCVPMYGTAADDYCSSATAKGHSTNAGELTLASAAPGSCPKPMSTPGSPDTSTTPTTPTPTPTPTTPTSTAPTPQPSLEIQFTVEAVGFINGEDGAPADTPAPGTVVVTVRDSGGNVVQSKTVDDTSSAEAGCEVELGCEVFQVPVDGSISMIATPSDPGAGPTHDGVDMPENTPCVADDAPELDLDECGTSAAEGIVDSSDTVVYTVDSEHPELDVQVFGFDWNEASS